MAQLPGWVRKHGGWVAGLVHNPADGKAIMWHRLVLWVLLLKLLLYVVDPSIKFFLGDSRSYIYSALAGWVPPDRSFLYPLFISLCTLSSHSLASLVFAQVLISACVALLVAAILARFFGAGNGTCAAAALLCAIEPIQLFYERSVMTEAVSLFFFALFVYSTLEYMQDRRVRTLVLALVAGLLMVKMRMAFAPVYTVGIAAVVFTDLAHYRNAAARAAESGGLATKRMLARCLLAPAIAVVMAVSVHALERHYRKVPAYSETGYFVLSAWSPLLLTQRIPFGPDLMGLAAGMPCRLGNLNMRNGQRWAKDCLIERLRHKFKDDRKANRFALRAGVYLLLHDPFGVAKLALETYGQYWSTSDLEHAVVRHRGLDHPLSAQFRKELIDNYGLHASALPGHNSIIGKYFSQSVPWYMMIMASPLMFLFLFVMGRHRRGEKGFLVAVYLTQLAVIVTLATQVSIRYLQPLAWLTIVGAGACLGMVMEHLRGAMGAQVHVTAPQRGID